MRYIFILVLVLGIASSAPRPAIGHDLKALAVEAKRWSAGLHAETLTALRPRTLRSISKDADISIWSTKQVIEAAGAWTMPHAFSICFDQSASNGVRKRIAATIEQQWPLQRLTAGRLRYGHSFNPDELPTCSTDPFYYTNYDVRVTFDTSLGYWAQVGRPSTVGYPTLNLANFDTSPPVESRFQFLVAHEFGHVLGLMHELQHPKAPPCKWNKDAIKSAEHWTEQDWDWNMSAIKQFFANGTAAYDLLPYDQRSIMHYHFGASFFQDGSGDSCYIPTDNPAPDKSDYAIVEARYSAMALKQQPELAQQIRDVLPHLGRFVYLRAALKKRLAPIAPFVIPGPPHHFNERPRVHVLPHRAVVVHQTLPNQR